MTPSEMRSDLVGMIADMTAWEFAQLAVSIRAVKTLDKEQVQEFQDLVVVHGVSIFEATHAYGIDITLDEVMGAAKYDGK